MTQELHKKYRPTTLDEVEGQDTAVKAVRKMLDSKRIPHAVVFSGPSGVGKTTLARIMAGEMGCDPEGPDFSEVNCGAVDALKAIREIGEGMGMSPMFADQRVCLLDETQSLSRARFAQEALLKMLEEPPAHFYFFLATTEPQKLLKTIRTRATEVTLKPMRDEHVRSAILHTLKRARKDLKFAKVTTPVIDKLVELADGSARQAIKTLDHIIGYDDEASRLEYIQKADVREQGIAIARAIFQRKSWREVADVIKHCDEEPEAVRRIILAYASTILLNSGQSRAHLVIEHFRDHWYDCGKAGLVSSCYAVCTSK